MAMLQKHLSARELGVIADKSQESVPRKIEALPIRFFYRSADNLLESVRRRRGV